MSEKKVSEIVNEMYDNDAFSQWLGIKRLNERPGYSKIRMEVREEMTNGFKIAHGGITFSLADSAFAFASNSQGRKSVSIECSINHVKSVHVGDILTAEAKESNLGNKMGIYHVTVTNQDKVIVALFKGIVYRTSKDW